MQANAGKKRSSNKVPGKPGPDKAPKPAMTSPNGGATQSADQPPAAHNAGGAEACGAMHAQPVAEQDALQAQPGAAAQNARRCHTGTGLAASAGNDHQGASQPSTSGTGSPLPTGVRTFVAAAHPAVPSPGGHPSSTDAGVGTGARTAMAERVSTARTVGMTAAAPVGTVPTAVLPRAHGAAESAKNSTDIAQHAASATAATMAERAVMEATVCEGGTTAECCAPNSASMECDQQ